MNLHRPMEKVNLLNNGAALREPPHRYKFRQQVPISFIILLIPSSSNSNTVTIRSGSILRRNQWLDCVRGAVVTPLERTNQDKQSGGANNCTIILSSVHVAAGLLDLVPRGLPCQQISLVSACTYYLYIGDI